MSNLKRSELDELFHQPVRLEIMAELCASSEGRSFIELRESCGLTDGNLNRHLQALSASGAVKTRRSFVRSRSHTTVTVTSKGRARFLEYLSALEEVLQEATARARKAPSKMAAGRMAAKPERA